MNASDTDISPLRPPMRIAFYGYADRDSGSVSSAGYVILRELLRRGHQIDFFGKKSFAFPVGFDAFPNFRFVDSEGRAERRLGEMWQRGNRLTRPILGRLLSKQTIRNIPKVMRREHARQPYDICFYFGTWAFGRVPGLQTISWVQGPPGTDSRSISRNAALLRRLEGVTRYFALRTFALYRDTLGQPPFANTDLAICGSRWAAGDLRKFVGERMQIASLPYPVDLDTFTSTGKVSSGRPIVLWAGRSVPRKRLDLFLDACDRLLDAGRDFDVWIIGGLSFAPGYRRLIDDFRHPQRLTYSSQVPRDQMPDIYRQAAVLVQPSEDENFGSAVAEALACGTPVVLGPTNGTGDYIDDAGFRFDRYDSAAVAKAIAAALDAVESDPQATSARARAAAEQYCDASTIVSRLETRLDGRSMPSLDLAAVHPLLISCDAAS